MSSPHKTSHICSSKSHTRWSPNLTVQTFFLSFLHVVCKRVEGVKSLLVEQQFSLQGRVNQRRRGHSSATRNRRRIRYQSHLENISENKHFSLVSFHARVTIFTQWRTDLGRFCCRIFPARYRDLRAHAGSKTEEKDEGDASCCVWTQGDPRYRRLRCFPFPKQNETRQGKGITLNTLPRQKITRHV